MDAMLTLQEAAVPLVSPQVLDAAARYALVALVGWVAASLQYGRKLTAADTAIRALMVKHQGETNARLETLERDVARVGAEVWGPKGESGLRLEVSNMHGTISQHGETLVRILSEVRQVAESLSIIRRPNP